MRKKVETPGLPCFFCVAEPRFGRPENLQPALFSAVKRSNASVDIRSDPQTCSCYPRNLGKGVRKAPRAKRGGPFFYKNKT